VHPYSSQAAAAAAAPTFSYRISASFSAKQHALDLARNQYFHNNRATYLPCSIEEISALTSRNREKIRYKSGQDAFFVSNTKESVAFGVVDGVGGWTDQGIDPAEFAHRLCEYMSDAASSYSNGMQKTELHSPNDVPKYLLQQGYDMVMEDRTVKAGGSTACVGLATAAGVLHIAK
jgi:protein phosphatase PTC7